MPPHGFSTECGARTSARNPFPHYNLKQLQNENTIIQQAIAICAIALVTIVASAATRPHAALAVMPGREFEGGAKDLVGTSFGGKEVNTTYSLQNGARSSMQAKFQIHNIPAVPLFVHLTARDDDAPGASSILIRLNGKTLFEGRNQFSGERYETRKLPIPAQAFVSGENTLVIASAEKTGAAGMPPWFQVASCVIAPEKFVRERSSFGISPNTRIP